MIVVKITPTNIENMNDIKPQANMNSRNDQQSKIGNTRAG